MKIGSVFFSFHFFFFFYLFLVLIKRAKEKSSFLSFFVQITIMRCSVRASRTNALAKSLGAAGASSSRRKTMMAPMTPATSTSTPASISTSLRRQSTTAASATKTTKAASPVAAVGTQLLKRVAGAGPGPGGAGADAVFVPAGGADTLIGRKLIYSLLRAGKKVVAGEFMLFLRQN